MEQLCFGPAAWSAETVAGSLRAPGAWVVMTFADGAVQEYRPASLPQTVDTPPLDLSGPSPASSVPQSFALLQWLPGQSEAELLRIAVDPAQRRRGLASILLRFLLQSNANFHRAPPSLAKSQRRRDNRDRPRRIILEVASDNTAALALYARFGFREIHRRRAYYRSGADALILEWQHSRTSD